MQTTSNYGFNIVEGTDIVNPLVDLNPNFTNLDAILKTISDKAFDRATCVKSGTNHAVTRTDTDRNLIIFTATGDWNTGDSMTIDGSPVSVYLPDGTAPLTGSYVINSEVLMIKNGSRVTIYTSQKLPDYDADDISYDNTGSGLNSNDVQGAIDEVADAIDYQKARIVSARLSGTTSNTGDISIGITPLTSRAYVLHNIPVTLGDFYGLYVNNVGADYISFKVRSLVDNSAVINTPIDEYIALIFA